MYTLSVSTEVGLFYWGETPDGWKGWTRRRDQAVKFNDRTLAATAALDLIRVEPIPREEMADAT